MGRPPTKVRIPPGGTRLKAPKSHVVLDAAGGPFLADNDGRFWEQLPDPVVSPRVIDMTGRLLTDQAGQRSVFMVPALMRTEARTLPVRDSGTVEHSMTTGAGESDVE